MSGKKSDIQEGQAEQEAQKPVCNVCDNKASTRGVCSTCYSTFQTLVNNGKTTWEDLEAAGVVNPSKRKKAGPSKAMQAFNAMIGKGWDPLASTKAVAGKDQPESS